MTGQLVHSSVAAMLSTCPCYSLTGPSCLSVCQRLLVVVEIRQCRQCYTALHCIVIHCHDVDMNNAARPDRPLYVTQLSVHMYTVYCTLLYCIDLQTCVSNVIAVLYIHRVWIKKRK